MPLFSFTCKACNQTFELLQRHGASAACPECGSREVSKQLGVIAPPSRNAAGEFHACGAPSCCQMAGGACMN